MSCTNLVVEAWTCWAIAVVFIAVRISARVSNLGWRQLKLDDGLMFAALVCSTLMQFVWDIILMCSDSSHIQLKQPHHTTSWLDG